MDILKVRMVPQPIKIRADFKLTCFEFEGIDAIKYALLEGEKLSTPEIQIKFRVIGSPLYECSTVTINRSEGLKLIGLALKAVEKSIALRKGNFLLQTNPTILGETTDNLKDQLKDVIKNTQDIDEEPDEDHDEGIKANIDVGMDDDLRLNTKQKTNEESDDDS
jgi:translation initiation factor 2 subunit 1